MLGTPNIADYLGALATRDDLISRDQRFDEDLGDELRAAALHMRDGFIDSFMSDLLARSDAERRALTSEIIVHFRKRLISNIVGRPIDETRLETFLRVADKHGFPARAWLKSDTELEDDREENAFLIAVQKALWSTNLAIPDRTRCVAAIYDAFLKHEYRRELRAYNEWREAERNWDFYGRGAAPPAKKPR